MKDLARQRYGEAREWLEKLPALEAELAGSRRSKRTFDLTIVGRLD